MHMSDLILKREHKTTQSKEISIGGKKVFLPVRPPGSGWAVMRNRGATVVWCRVRFQPLSSSGQPLTLTLGPCGDELAVIRSIAAYIQEEEE